MLLEKAKDWCREKQDRGCFLLSSSPMSLSPAVQHAHGIGDHNARSSEASQPCCCPLRPLCPYLVLWQGSTCTQPMAQLHPTHLETALQVQIQ